MLLRVCEKNHPSIVYATNELKGDCPHCRLQKWLDDLELENRELKAEVHRQAEQLGKPTLIAVINQELVESTKELLNALDDCPGEFRYSVAVEDRARNALAHAEKLAEHPEKEKV